MSGRNCVLLAAHGTVEQLSELEAFLTVIRRGHAPPPSLLEEVRRRYEAIGGKSPLLDTTRLVAQKLSTRIGGPVRVAMRLWNPLIPDVVKQCLDDGFSTLVVLALAQYSSHLYEGSVREAASALGDNAPAVIGVGAWGSNTGLLEVYAKRVRDALREVPEEARAKTRVLLSAHSLPVAIVRGGDPYEDQVRAAASALRSLLPDVKDATVIFQSQGMSTGPGGRPMAWLGPDVRASLENAKNDGVEHVIFAPIGFLADHVEVLYDLDVEARHWAEEMGIRYHRMASPNADEDFIDVLASLVKPLYDPA